MYDYDFRDLTVRILENAGPDTLRTPAHVERITAQMDDFDSADIQMFRDMAEGHVFDLFLDGTEDAYEKSFSILQDAGHSKEEITEDLDDLKAVLNFHDLNDESDSEKTVKEADDIVFGRNEVQDYEEAARLYADASFWENPRSRFISLMSAVKNQENDISQILNGETVKEKVSPGRSVRFTTYFQSVAGEEEAVDLLKDCAEHNVPEAQYLLGRCYGLKNSDSFVTRYIQPDEDKAKEWMEKATQNGFTEELSEEEKRDAVINADHPDPEKLKELAEEGYAEAQIRYAETFSSDNEERFVWMRKAADQENITATRKLAFLYKEENDQENYMKWLKKASSMPDPKATYLLGLEYQKPENEDGSENPDYDFYMGENLINLATSQVNFDAMIAEMKKEHLI